jgi:hypothetical protein
VSAFLGTNHNLDLTTAAEPAVPTSAGQKKAKSVFDSLNTPETGLIARIQANAGTQASGTGTSQSGTTSKTVLRDALFLELRGLNRSAIAIAAAQDKPEIMDQFRMPYSVGDSVLVAKASAIAKAAEPFTSDFIDLGHEPTFVDDLRNHIKALETAETMQDTGEQTHVGATAEFGPLLEEAMKAVKQLDAFVHNFYKSDAEALGEWKTASHVERQKKVKKEETPAAPKP